MKLGIRHPRKKERKKERKRLPTIGLIQQSNTHHWPDFKTVTVSAGGQGESEDVRFTIVGAFSLARLGSSRNPGTVSNPQYWCNRLNEKKQHTPIYYSWKTPWAYGALPNVQVVQMSTCGRHKSGKMKKMENSRRVLDRSNVADEPASLRCNALLWGGLRPLRCCVAP